MRSIETTRSDIWSYDICWLIGMWFYGMSTHTWVMWYWSHSFSFFFFFSQAIVWFEVNNLIIHQISIPLSVLRHSWSNFIQTFKKTLNSFLERFENLREDPAGPYWNEETTRNIVLLIRSQRHPQSQELNEENKTTRVLTFVECRLFGLVLFHPAINHHKHINYWRLR